MPNISSSDRLTPRVIKTDFAVFLGLLILGIIIYLPVLNKGLLSDDYLVMRRVGLDGVVFIKGFFRPLSDITLYFNYWMGGFEGIYYTTFNLLLHVFGSFFLYLFAKRWQGLDVKNKTYFSILVAVLFLTYPFHNESVVWGVGRASLLAGFFGILALLVLVTDWGFGWRLFFVNLFYFIGLTAYESIFLLPLMVILVAWSNKKPIKRLIFWGSSMAFTVLLHMIIRKVISGGIIGGYAEGVFDQGKGQYVSNLLRICGRLFLPPGENSMLLTILFVILLAVLLLLGWIHIKRKKTAIPAFLLVALLAISLVVPLTFPVSTRTSESDRLLYFPSVFVCLMIAFLVTELIQSRKWFFTTASLLVLYNIYFLEKNNLNWRKASEISVNFLDSLKSQAKKDKRLLILNVPDEYNGAYIFRNGFEDALIIHKLDTARIRRASRLKWEDYKTIPEEIVPERRGDTLLIAPANKIYLSRQEQAIFIDSAGTIKGPYPLSDNELWYWNKKQLKPASVQSE